MGYEQKVSIVSVLSPDGRITLSLKAKNADNRKHKEKMMLKKIIPSLLTSLIFLNTHAQTPDGETPFNEGVCDDLLGSSTPGLYGMCVAFCEAQDCDATFDPVTGEFTFSESCNPSSTNILSAYNAKKNEMDPSMPCVNVVQPACPCWTETELDGVAERTTSICEPHDFAFITGHRLLGFNESFGIEGAVAATSVFTGTTCSYIDRNPISGSGPISRNIQITDGELGICVESLVAECASRGF